MLAVTITVAIAVSVTIAITAAVRIYAVEHQGHVLELLVLI